jgi:hypothetical protein
MDPSVVAALVVALGSLLVSGSGGLFALYQFRTKHTRQANQDLLLEQGQRIDLLKEEVREYKAEIASLRQQSGDMQIRNATMLQVLSAVYRQPPEVIDWRLNGTRIPEVRN